MATKRNGVGTRAAIWTSLGNIVLKKTQKATGARVRGFAAPRTSPRAETEIDAPLPSAGPDGSGGSASRWGGDVLRTGQRRGHAALEAVDAWALSGA